MSDFVDVVEVLVPSGKGDKGDDGDPGPGVPEGGDDGQVLAKASGADFDTEWVDPAAGGGAVDSVNAQTGVVVLDAADVGADPAGSAAAAQAASQPVDSDLSAIAALSTTAYGRAFLALADAAAGRTALGLGTAATEASSAFDAAGSAAAAQAASQPVDGDLTALAALTTTAYGRSLLEAANAAALRTLAGLGTAATSNTGDFDPAGSAAAAQAASQPVDSDLTAIAALSTTAYGRAFLALADASAGRTALGLGTAATSNTGDFDAAGAAAAAQAASQPVDSDLTAIAALTTTSFGRSLLAAADAAALRTLAALGTIATEAETAYALLAGRASGQTLAGGTGASDALTLRGSTNSAHAGAINVNSPGFLYDADETFTADPGALVNLRKTYTLDFAGAKFGGSGGILAFGATFKFAQTGSAIPTTILSNLSTYTNVNGVAANLGANKTINSDVIFQADGATISAGPTADFSSSMTFQVANAGVLSGTPDTVSFQAQLQVGAGCTVTPYSAFVVKPPTGAGAVTDFVGFQVRAGGAPSTNLTGLQINALTGAGVNFGINIEQPSGGTNNIGLRNVGATAFPQTIQTITATTDTITILGTHIRLNNTSGSSKTLASTPTLATGAAGQIIIITNTSANDVVLQDQGTLPSSSLRLGAATRTLSTRDTIILMYNSTVGDWLEIAFSNVL